MRIPTLGLWLLAAALGARAELLTDLSRSHDQLGGGLALFAATIVEGGGAKGSNNNPPRAIIEVSEEFSRQHLAPGRISIGKQEAVFRLLASSAAEERQGFEVPANGTRLIAFGDPARPPLIVYVNHLFADTPASRASIAAGRMQPSTVYEASSARNRIQMALFAGSLGAAFGSIFLPWLRIRYGVIGVAVSVALWLAYETQIPTQVNIRVDLVILLPMILAALISTVFAAANKRVRLHHSKPPDE
jgi:hypothetical protein